VVSVGEEQNAVTQWLLSPSVTSVIEGGNIPGVRFVGGRAERNYAVVAQPRGHQ
jgi:hypothetical protein